MPTFVTGGERTFATHELVAKRPSGRFWYCRHMLQDITKRRRLEQELAREKVISDAITESASNAFFLVDEESKLVRWNSTLVQRLGLTDDELRELPLLSLVHPDDRAEAQAKLLTVLATGCATMDIRVGDGKGPSIYLTTARRLVIDDRQFVAGFCTDITNRAHREQTLARHDRFSDSLIENIPGVFCVVDGEGNYVRWNSNRNRLTGLSDQELNHRNSLMAVAEEDRPLAASRLREAIERGYSKAVLRVPSQDRGVRAFVTTGRRFYVGDIPYIVGVGIDTTDELAELAAMKLEAHTDALTHIAARGHFMELATDEFARCRRYGHPLSVWMVDLDHFKDVNDTYGHQAGDVVLRSFVEVCQRAVRDWDTMGRMGGEEFAVVMPETESAKALLVAERLRQSVATTAVSVGAEESVSITVSIGIAAANADDTDVHAVLERADRALYKAKHSGRDKVCLA
jgi:diguanylate cyclase (GGDEF)-like protein/PAS domain S-box-containing protein